MIHLSALRKDEPYETQSNVITFRKLSYPNYYREEGKRNYQLIIAVVACAALGFGVAWIAFH